MRARRMIGRPEGHQGLEAIEIPYRIKPIEALRAAHQNNPPFDDAARPGRRKCSPTSASLSSTDSSKHNSRLICAIPALAAETEQRAADAPTDPRQKPSGRKWRAHGNSPAPARSDARGVHREWRMALGTPAGAPGESASRKLRKPPGSGQERCGNGQEDGGAKRGVHVGSTVTGPDLRRSIAETKGRCQDSDRTRGIRLAPRQTLTGRGVAIRPHFSFASKGAGIDFNVIAGAQGGQVGVDLFCIAMV